MQSKTELLNRIKRQLAENEDFNAIELYLDEVYEAGYAAGAAATQEGK